MLYAIIAALTLIAGYFAYHCNRLFRRYSTQGDLFVAFACGAAFAAFGIVDVIFIILAIDQHLR